MRRLKRSAPVLAVLACSLAPQAAMSGQTISAEKIAATIRLTPLQKLTVGPDDQYDGSATDASGRRLIYTRKADLIASLRMQDTETGEFIDLLPANVDSQAAIMGPDNRVAFSFFRFNARGDVCFATLPSGKMRPWTEKEISCLDRAKDATSTQRSNPFWRAKEELGYLERDVAGSSSRIVIENLNDRSRKVVAEGRVWSPSMRPGGTYLVYNEIISEKGQDVRRVVLQDLAANKRYVARFDVPGISGFPVLSEDESQVYFSHYLNDTNNDRSIDGGDNAVVFRIPVADVIAAETAKKALTPEQLTSAETSCSFPHPAAARVYVTCAFEGSLDVYSIPAGGVVPRDWDESRLANALQTSRSYQDRILLLNALRTRTKADARLVDDRLLSNHIYADDMVAAHHYLDRLKDGASNSDRRFYDLLVIALDGRELAKAQASEVISREFRSQIMVLDGRAMRIEGAPQVRALVRGLLRTYLRQTADAERFLREAQSAPPGRPLERYFRFDLARRVYTLGLPKTLSKLIEAHREMMAAKDLSDESRIYYAFSALKLLGRNAANEAARTARISAIEDLSKGMSGQVASLLKAEVLTLKLIEAADDKAKMMAYRDIDAIMAQTRSDYFLKKAIYVRAITNLSDAAEFKYLTLIATNWLRYTTQDDSEFIYAREVFAESALDRGYENLEKGQLDFAGNFFYESISLTDDLEAHVGYVNVMLAKNERSTLNERYKNLTTRKFVIDNMKFVEALLTVLEGGAKSEAGIAPEKLEIAVAKLEAMTQDRDSSVRHLLLGYCYLQQLLNGAKGVEFDSALFQKAHRSLSLAYDIGRDNRRVKAAALMNLGILHQRVQNHGLANRYFSARKELGFRSDADQADFDYLYARSLGRGLQPEAAARELASTPPKATLAPHLERRAFYAMAAGRFDEAVEAYGRVLGEGQIKGEMDQAKVRLSYGYSLFKAGKEPEARAELGKVLQLASKLSPVKANGDQILDFHPARLEYVANGLLSQMGDSAAKRAALERRLALLESKRDLAEDWKTAMVLGRLRDAELATASDPKAAMSSLNEALKIADEIGSSAGYVGNAVHRALVSYLAHGLLHPAAHGQDAALVKTMVEKAVKAIDDQKIKQPVLEFQKLKTQMLWSAYTRRTLKSPAGAEISALLASAQMKVLETTQPEQWQELTQLAKALSN